KRCARRAPAPCRPRRCGGWWTRSSVGSTARSGAERGIGNNTGAVRGRENTMTETIIRTERLTRRFGGKTVVGRLDLEVPRGAIFALFGDNGAGKSTTIRMLMGLLPPDAGRAEILGEDCWANAIALRHRVGYVPEKPRFYDWMTVRE